MSVAAELRETAAALTVLFVDDEPELREQMGQLLGKFFGRVVPAVDGRDGLERFETERPDLVITDIRMPVMDGLEMTAELRRRHRDTAVVVASAFDDKELLIRAIDLGVGQYLIKPFEPALLLAALHKVVQNLTLERKVRRLSRRIQEIINAQDSLVAVLQGETITAANLPFLQLFGVASLRELRERNLSLGQLLVREPGFCAPLGDAGWIDLLLCGGDSPRIKLIDRARGRARAFVARLSPLADGSDERIVTLTDVTDLERQLRELQRAAATDPLTQLPNRLQLVALAEAAVERAHRDGTPLTLLLAVVGGLREVNARRGYQAGDRLLIDAARRLGEALPATATLARWRGNAFALLLPATPAAEAAVIAAAVQRRLAGDGELTVRIAVVVATAGDDADALLQRAEGMTRESGGSAIRLDPAAGRDAAAGQDERQEIIALLRSLPPGAPLHCHNFHKGLGIANDGTLLQVTGEEIAVRLHRHQLAAVSRQRFTLFTAPPLPRPVRGEAVRLDAEKRVATLGRLQYVAESALDRKLVRLEPHGRVETTLRGDNGTAGGRLVDLSLNAVSVEVAAAAPLRLGADVTIAFALPQGRESAAIDGEGRVIKLRPLPQGFLAVASLFLTAPAEKALRHYLSTRQQELIRELQHYGE